MRFMCVTVRCPTSARWLVVGTDRAVLSVCEAHKHLPHWDPSFPPVLIESVWPPKSTETPDVTGAARPYDPEVSG